MLAACLTNAPVRAADCAAPATLLDQLGCAERAADSADAGRWTAVIDRMARDARVVPQNLFRSQRVSAAANGSPGAANGAPTAEAPIHLLAPPADEVFAARIGWHVNDARAALEQGIAQGIPTVVLFGAPDCRWCQWMLRDVMRCEAIERFAGRAVFAYSEPERDPAARAMAAVLEIEWYPAIVMIEPDARRLNVPAQIRGFFYGHRFSKLMEKYLERTEAWQRPAPSIAQTKALRVEKGFAASPPPPQACEAIPIWMK